MQDQRVPPGYRVQLQTSGNSHPLRLVLELTTPIMRRVEKRNYTGCFRQGCLCGVVFDNLPDYCVELVEETWEGLREVST
jgi:hypothetical protein